MPLSIRLLTALPDFHRCVSLQQHIWHESDLETEPHTAFVIAHQTGGQVIGAFNNGTLIGFTLAVVGIRREHNNQPYLHSHMTGVLPDYRDRQVGRALKLFQREDALSRNITHIEWTFDPFETRNAHFNFNRLGAISRKYLPNFYGITSSPLHRNVPTDRLLVEWHLNSPRVHAALQNIDRPISAEISTAGSPRTTAIDLPSELEAWKASADPAPLIAFQSTLRQKFLSAFSQNQAITSIQISPTHSTYLLESL